MMRLTRARCSALGPSAERASGAARLAVCVCASALACSAAPLPLPAAPAQKTSSELAHWQTPPPLAPERRLDLEWHVERERLGSGLGISAVSRPESAVTSIALWVPTARDTGHGAVAAMVEALRAGTLSSDGVTRIDPRLARQPIAVSTDANGSFFSWIVLPRATERALGWLGDFVTHPSFEPEATRIVLQQVLAVVQRDSGTARHIADVARDALPGIQIASPERDARGLFRLTPDVLRQVHRCALSARGAELVVVGPESAAEMLRWARAAFTGFGGSGASSRSAPAAQDAAGCAEWALAADVDAASSRDRLDVQIIYGGAFDPWVVLVVPGPALDSDDYLPFALLARVLDGRDSGAARLRHMGATYGIHSRIEEGYPGGVLLELEGQVAPDGAQGALRRLIEDIRGLSRSLQAPELEEVKRRWRTAFVNSLANDATLARAALWQLRRGRTPEAVKSLPDELSQITLERCREVAAKWLNDAQPSIAIAGLPVKLLRGLGFRTNVRRNYWTDELLEQKKAL